MRARRDGRPGGLGEGGRPRAVVDAVEPDRELVRLRAENLALKGELIGLRLAADRGTPREPGGAEAGLSDLAGELRRMALRAERLAEAGRPGARPPRGAAPRGEKDPHALPTPLPGAAGRGTRPPGG